MVVLAQSKVVSAIFACISHDYWTFLPFTVKSTLAYAQKHAWRKEWTAGEEKRMFYNLNSCDFEGKMLGLKGRVCWKLPGWP